MQPTVSLQGQLLAIGTWWNFGAAVEEVVLYEPGTGGWIERARLAPTPLVPAIGFGRKVQVFDDTVLVAALYDPHPNTPRGAVYVFRRSLNSWFLESKIAGPSAYEWFADDFDYDGEHLVVGAPHRGSNGAAFVYQRQGTGWGPAALLQETSLPYASGQGRAVAIDGNWLAVGAPANGSQSIPSRVLVYRRAPSGAWSLHSDLLSPEGGDRFGSQVELDGKQLVVGAYSGRQYRGRVYVYERPSASGPWSLVQELDPTFAPQNSSFGYSLSLDRNRLAVGAPEGYGHRGSTYFFVREEEWTPIARLRSASPGGAWQQFGSSLSLDGRNLVVGAIEDQLSFVFELGPQCPEVFCQAKINSLFCYPTIDSAGLASISTSQRFEIVGRDIVPDEAGVLLYGTSGRGSVPFHGGKLCVKLPFVRLSPTKNSGHSGPGLCSGVLSTDFNARIQGGADPALEPGTRVVAQWLYRDPPVDAFGDGLTEALEFVVAP